MVEGKKNKVRSELPKTDYAMVLNLYFKILHLNSS